MAKLSILLCIVYSVSSFALCVHEKTLKGFELLDLQKTQQVFVETKGAIFLDANKIKVNPAQTYKVHLSHKKSHTKSTSFSTDPHEVYNQKYIEYYTYARMQKYINDNRAKIIAAGFEIRIIGKSIEGRDLYAITPKKLLKKKTILMFGRHHGDEGTANWIIEGFFNEYLTNKKFSDEYQLVLYPMINPDGAEAHIRYNANGRDLNRSWHKDLSESFDEVNIIHTDLKKIMTVIKKDIFIALDMHGSFREDFIYRVKKKYVNRSFYNLQQNFIDELGAFDLWQKGNFKLSNGDSRMARLVLIDHYKKNAMTHESIRNIDKYNSEGRSVDTLKDQGLALIKSISNLY